MMTTGYLADATLLADMGPERILEAAGYPARAVVWGKRWQFGTPAYWVAATELAISEHRVASGPGRHRLGASLPEELAACMLGGYGMPYEVGLAAFHAVREQGLLSGLPASAEQIEEVLRRPLQASGRTCRYRFPAQRSERLAAALAYLYAGHQPAAPVALRDWLLGAPGVGPKTAGWVVRNHLDSDDVAIIDVHVLRAGQNAGVFDMGWTPARHYPLLEALFLAWARHGGVRASDLDAVIWAEQAAAIR